MTRWLATLIMGAACITSVLVARNANACSPPRCNGTVLVSNRVPANTRAIKVMLDFGTKAGAMSLRGGDGRTIPITMSAEDEVSRVVRPGAPLVVGETLTLTIAAGCGSFASVSPDASSDASVADAATEPTVIGTEFKISRERSNRDSRYREPSIV